MEQVPFPGLRGLRGRTGLVHKPRPSPPADRLSAVPPSRRTRGKSVPEDDPRVSGITSPAFRRRQETPYRPFGGNARDAPETRSKSACDKGHKSGLPLPADRRVYSTYRRRSASPVTGRDDEVCTARRPVSPWFVRAHDAGASAVADASSTAGSSNPAPTLERPGPLAGKAEHGQNDDAVTGGDDRPSAAGCRAHRLKGPRGRPRPTAPTPGLGGPVAPGLRRQAPRRSAGIAFPASEVVRIPNRPRPIGSRR